MPTSLGPEYSNTFTGTPTHISPRDLAIWRAWWPTVQPYVSSIWFDVGLGTGATGDPQLSIELQRMWTKNTQKRADIVMRYKARLWIVELRATASASALGRLQLYQHLWNIDPPLTGRVDTWLITDQRDPDVEQLAHTLTIHYTVVPTTTVPPPTPRP